MTIPDGGAEGVIATMGGRCGGYALMLSPSASWLLSSKPFKYIELGLLIFGLLLIFIGTAGRWRKRFGYAFVLVAAVGLILSFATDIFHIGRGRPVFVYNLLDLERSVGEDCLRSTQASTPSCLTSNMTAPASPRAVPAC